eukprot:354508-Chlamydomonas_euryale.AAC.2
MGGMAVLGRPAHSCGQEICSVGPHAHAASRAGAWHMGGWHMGRWHMGGWHMGRWHNPLAQERGAAAEPSGEHSVCRHPALEIYWAHGWTDERTDGRTDTRTDARTDG